MYTSASHDPDVGKIKCRLVFRTEYDIDNGTDLTFLYTGLMAVFGSDQSCKDPCRMFFGSKGAYYEQFPDKFLPWDVVKELIKKGKEITRENLGYTKQTDVDLKAIPNNPFSGKRQTIEQDTEIRLTDGDVIKFREIPTLFKRCGAKNNDLYKFQCYCPLHNDSNASAFISTNKSNTPYLYCSKCSPAVNGGKAFFMAYNQNLDLEESKVNIIERNERYLSKLPDFKDVLLGKSPKGTGKTKQLISIVDECKKEKKRVLLIGHRISLLQSMSGRLGLDFYLDTKIKHDNHINGTPHMAICINSLLKMTYFDKYPYDVILLDESEQLITHLVGDTISADERESLMEHFSKLLRKSGQVICMDADLSDITIETICNLIMGVPDDKITAVINTWKPEERTLNVYEKLNDIQEEMFQAFNTANKDSVAVLSNSKNKILNYQNTLRDMHPHLQVLTITSDNSQDEHIQHCLKNINKTLKDYDVFLASPSIGTGVDITESVNQIFGIFEHATGNTAADIDQHLHRFRNPKNVSVWINPTYGTEETDDKVILHKMLYANAQTNDILGYPEPPTNQTQLHYAKIKSLVDARTNLSRNQLRNNWLATQYENNITINHIIPSEDEELSHVAKSHLDSVKKNKEQMITDLWNMVNNEHIDDELYNDTNRKKRKDYGDKLIIEAYKIQQFFTGYDDISIEIVKDYKNLMRDVLFFEEANTSKLKLKKKDALERLSHYLISDRNNSLASIELKTAILTKFCGITSIHDTDTYLTTKTLQPFVQLLDANKSDVEAVLGIRFAANYLDKPVQQVGKIINSVGLKLASEQVQVNGKRERRYFIDKSYYDTIYGIYTKRLNGHVDHGITSSISVK